MRYVFFFVALFLTASLAMAGTGQTSLYPVSKGVTSDRHVTIPVTEGAVLYDQTGAAVIGSGYTSQDFEAVVDIYDSQGADDFVVPAGETWNINQVAALGLYYNGNGLMPSANVYFYDDAAGYPGNLLASENVVPTDDTTGNIICDITEVSLGEGTYWVSVQAVMDFQTGGQWGWTPNDALTNSGAAWQNPGDGFVTGCTTWGRITSCIFAEEDDLAFILSGNTGGGCEFALDLPKMKYRPGEAITFDISLHHRAETNVTVPIYAWVENADRSVITSTVSEPLEINQGDFLTLGMTLSLPIDLPPGGYRVRASVGEMVQGVADAQQRFKVISPSPFNQASTLLEGVPEATVLLDNYPNPFNPSTTISYGLSQDTWVNVRIHNSLGEEVATLVNEHQTAGFKTIVWNGTDNFGTSVSSGIYLYRMTTADHVETKRLLLLK